MDWQERSRRLIGDEEVNRLGRAHVILFGLGGVGSFAAEALARSGLGRLSLVDGDIVTESNRNRQLPALSSTVGSGKLDVCGARLKDINPALKLFLYSIRMNGDNLDGIISGSGGAPDFLADAIDDIPAKVSLIALAKEKGTPLISSMGTGYRLDPSLLEIGDISRTHTCPLARRLRRSLRERGIEGGVPVVWSREPPLPGTPPANDPEIPAAAGPASMIFVPAAAGLLMASYIIRRLIMTANDSRASGQADDEV